MNQHDLDLLNEIANHFDDIGDGAPDSSHAAIFANQHEKKLRALIGRAEEPTITQTLEYAFEKLLLEAIHFRNTGVGIQFLNIAIENADNALSNWKQSRPTTMGVYGCKPEDKR